jgi:CO dehydrogenase/acetyl-CoA synthase alpha subunit
MNCKMAEEEEGTHWKHCDCALPIQMSKSRSGKGKEEGKKKMHKYIDGRYMCTMCKWACPPLPPTQNALRVITKSRWKEG